MDPCGACRFSRHGQCLDRRERNNKSWRWDRWVNGRGTSSRRAEFRRETAGAYLKTAGIAVRPPSDWGQCKPKPANEVITNSGAATPAIPVIPDPPNHDLNPYCNPNPWPETLSTAPPSPGRCHVCGREIHTAAIATGTERVVHLEGCVEVEAAYYAPPPGTTPSELHYALRNCCGDRSRDKHPFLSPRKTLQSKIPGLPTKEPVHSVQEAQVLPQMRAHCFLNDRDLGGGDHDSNSGEMSMNFLVGNLARPQTRIDKSYGAVVDSFKYNEMPGSPMENGWQN
jgi:hypothetical protein